MTQPKKDIALIGTSPIMLLKTLLLAKKFPESKLTLFDGFGKEGGAWYTDQSPMGYAIECGCHIWSYCPEVYAYIEKEIGVPLYPLKPDAIFIGKSFRVPYSAKNTIDTYKFIAKNLLKFKFKKLKEVKTNPALRTKLFKRNKYPKWGSPELIKKLMELINEQSNVSIRPNDKIDSIHLGDKVELKGEFGGLEYDQIHMTSVSQLDYIQTAESRITIDSKQMDYIHFLVKTDRPLLKKLFYWRLIDDPVIHRISDISYQTDHKENLLLIGIKEDAFHAKKERELMLHCINKMKDLDLIDGEFELDLIKTHIYPTHYIDAAIREKLKNINSDQLNLIHSTDMMYGMYFLLQEEGLI